MEVIPGVREKILRSRVISQFLHLASKGTLKVWQDIDPSEIERGKEISKGGAAT